MWGSEEEEMKMKINENQFPYLSFGLYVTFGNTVLGNVFKYIQNQKVLAKWKVRGALLSIFF
jgi:hypothetical protein